LNRRRYGCFCAVIKEKKIGDCDSKIRVAEDKKSSDNMCTRDSTDVVTAALLQVLLGGRGREGQFYQSSLAILISCINALSGLRLEKRL